MAGQGQHCGRAVNIGALLRVLVLACTLCCLFLVADSISSAASARAEPPPTYTLGEGWVMRSDFKRQGTALGWQSGSEPQKWTSAAVPSVFKATPTRRQYRGRVTWYRTTFEGPSAPGYGWAFDFEQVRRRAAVYLNGKLLGKHRDPYSPFSLNATGLKPGQPNLLAVRVDNRLGRLDREGWWNWGGITRPVKLRPVGSVELTQLGVMPRLRCRSGGSACKAAVTVDVLVRNRNRVPQAPQIAVNLKSPRGVVTARSISVPPLKPGQQRRVRFAVPVAGTPELWDPITPQLYETSVEARVGGNVVQREQLRTGLRSVRVHNGLLQLNFRPVSLRGASIHEDLPGKGAALGTDGIEQIITDLKNVGAKVTRSHYPLSQQLLSRLDEEGILVWGQAPVYHADVLLKHGGERKQAIESVRSAVLAHRSHPSVITNSIANELSVEPDHRGPTRRFIARAVAAARDLDHSVPVSIDLFSYPGYPCQRSYRQIPMLGINAYFGWYRGRKGHSTSRLDQLPRFLKAMRHCYPNKAIVMTEFGAETVFKGSSRRRGTYKFQKRLLRRTLKIVKRSKYLSGAIYWTLREFAVKPHWVGGLRRARIKRTTMHRKGLLTYTGVPKPAWYVARSRFMNTPVYRYSGRTKKPPKTKK